MTPEQLADIHRLSETATRPWTAMDFAEVLQSANTILIADQNGFALGKVAADEAELLLIATSPQMRKQGVARRNLVRLEARAFGEGAKCMFLDVAADNIPAISLYRSVGYEPVGKRKGYYRKNTEKRVDALIFSKSLTGTVAKD